MEEGFLKDICAHPEELTARLVYADWLDDRDAKGDAARAEFVRVQCRLHGKELLAPEEARRLDQRQADLLEVWKKVWTRPFKGLFNNYDFRRGFIERATMNVTTFLAQGERILAMTPLRLAKLLDPAHYVEELSRCAALSRLWGLSLNEGKMGGTRLEKLLASPHLGKVVWLDLGNNDVNQAGAKHLVAAAPRLAGLRFLALEDNKLGDAGLEHLTRSPFLGRIEALNIDGNKLTDDGVRALVESLHAGKLGQLHIGRNQGLGLSAVEALIASPNLPSLRWLHIDGFTSMEDAVKRLAKRYGRRVELDTAGAKASLEFGPLAKL